MDNSKIRGRDAILQVGRQLYGDAFDLASESDLEMYKFAFEKFLKMHQGKDKKGVILVGDYGVGKTALMRVMQRLFKDSNAKFKYVSAYELRDLSEELTLSQIKEMYGYDLKHDLYIDDIGANIDVRRYGNVVNVIAEIISERYDLFIDSGFRTHFTTNLIPLDKDLEVETDISLEKAYSKRMVDRIVEMCSCYIIADGKSKRK